MTEFLKLHKKILLIGLAAVVILSAALIGCGIFITSRDFIVCVKKDGLWYAKVHDENGQKMLDSGGEFALPLISPDGKNVAYAKDNLLIVCGIEDEIKVNITENPKSFAWGGESLLYYCDAKGGLKGYDFNFCDSKVYIEGNYRYLNITVAQNGKIYAEKEEVYDKDSNEFSKALGIMEFDPVSGTERMLISSEQAVANDLGFHPVLGKLSRDESILYVWEKVFSSSISADGVGLGYYDFTQDKYLSTGITALAYNENLDSNPAVSGMLAVICGEGRGMNQNKYLTFFNTETGISEKMSAEDMTVMTPQFSPDGKKLIFTAAKADEDYILWEMNPHTIYEMNLEDGSFSKRSVEEKSFDFYPRYLTNKEFLFLKKDTANDYAVYRSDGRRESLVARDIEVGSNKYYGFYETERFFDYYTAS